MAGGVTVNKTAYRVAAKVAGQDPEMDRVAARVAAVASAEALRHKRSGELAGSIRVRRGRVDRVITIDDPEALHIEYGHLAGGAVGALDGFRGCTFFLKRLRGWGNGCCSNAGECSA